MYLCIYVDIYMLYVYTYNIYIYIGFPKDHTPDKLQLVKDLVSRTVLQHVLSLRIYRNGRSQFLFHGQE